MSYSEIEKILLNGSAYINRCVVSKDVDFHSHNFVEIAYVAEGRGVHTIGETSYPVEKGNITIINYDVPHKFTVDSENLIIYNCIFTPAYFDTVLSGSRNFYDITHLFLLSNFYSHSFDSYINVIAKGNENVHVFNIFSRMLNEFECKQIGYKEIMRGYLIELLVILFRLQIQSNTNTNQRMPEVLEYISTHYKEDIRVRDLTSIAPFSTTHFHRMFKALTGTTVISYIQTLRVDEACRLLASTDKTVLEIANEVGYSDLKHFYSVFKKFTGKLPREFR